MSARERAREVVDRWVASKKATNPNLADRIAAFARAEVLRVLDDALGVLWERVDHEDYGHAKAAVTLDIAAIEALRARYKEDSDAEEAQ